MPEDLSEPTLVVIEPLCFFVVYPANVHHNIAGLEDGGISGPLKT